MDTTSPIQINISQIGEDSPSGSAQLRDHLLMIAMAATLGATPPFPDQQAGPQAPKKVKFFKPFRSIPPPPTSGRASTDTTPLA